MGVEERAMLLEKENERLKAEIEILLKTIGQLRESVNLLVNRYVTGENYTD